MPGYRSIRKERPKKKFRIPSSYVQWGVLGLVGVGVLFVVSRTLCRPPAEQGPRPVLSQAQTDLATVTKLLGDVTLDSITRALFPAELSPELVTAETLADQGRWHDAVAEVKRLLKDASPTESAALHGFAGYCYKEAASPDWALREFRSGLAAARASSGELVPWLAFSAGFLFQSRGFADSCIPFYLAAESTLRSLAAAAARPEWTAPLANNLGVAHESLKDSARARELFRLALSVLDTLVDRKAVRLVNDNLVRVERKTR
ncbi:hypothetical protein FJY69_09470 [candidate division WOR-3 bacterium]|nr:hypothetical protein [candidate division WOR-3 bacterium]